MRPQQTLNIRNYTMDPHAVENINIEPPEILITPSELKQAIPLSEKARETIAQGRSAI